MVRFLRRLLPLVALVATVSLVHAQDQVANPYYTYWSKSKVGATVVFKETTKLSGPAAASAPEGLDIKTVTYKLAEVTADKVVVETRVLQQENFGFVESAPTRHIYPAKMSKAVLADLLEETGAKGEAVTLKVGDKEMKVKLLSGKIKNGKEEVDFKIWVSDDIPGGIAKRMRTTRLSGEVVAETTVELVTFKKGD
jgi:hypothetical protein